MKIRSDNSFINENGIEKKISNTLNLAFRYNIELRIVTVCDPSTKYFKINTYIHLHVMTHVAATDGINTSMGII